MRISNIINVAIYAVIIVIICPSFSGLMALESIESADFEKDKNIMALPDPFSLPSMLRQLLDDMDRKAKEEEDRRKKKDVKAGVSGATKNTVVPEGGSTPVEVPNLPPLTVSGVIFSKSRPQVIIGGDVFSVNDVIKLPEGEVRVRSIEKSQVTLTFMGDSHILFVNGDPPKRLSDKK